MPDNNPTRLQDKGTAESTDLIKNGGSIFHGMGRLFILISDSQATSQIQILNLYPFLSQIFDQLFEFLQGLDNGLHLDQLGSDMTINSQNLKIWQLRSKAVSHGCAEDVNPKLILFQAGGDIG